MRLICCLSVCLLEMVRQHCPGRFLVQMYNRLSTTYAPCEVFLGGFFAWCFLFVFFGLFVCFSLSLLCFLCFFSAFFLTFLVYPGTIYIINK